MMPYDPSKRLAHVTLVLALFVAPGCGKSEERKRDERDGLAFVDAGPLEVCEGTPFEAVLETTDALQSTHEHPLGAAQIEISGPLTRSGEERLEAGQRVIPLTCTSAPAEASLRATHRQAESTMKVRCIECEATTSGTGPDPTSSSTPSTSSGGAGSSDDGLPDPSDGTTGGPSDGPTEDPPNDCEGTASGRTGCERFGLVDFLEVDVQCDGGLTATHAMAGPVEQDPGFLGRLEFTLTANGTAAAQSVYATVLGVSSDAGPFEFSAIGPSPVVLGPDDTFAIDADGAVVIHLSSDTLDGTGATFDTIDVQSNIVDDIRGVSLGDSVRDIPWPCP